LPKNRFRVAEQKVITVGEMVSDGNKELRPRGDLASVCGKRETNRSIGTEARTTNKAGREGLNRVGNRATEVGLIQGGGDRRTGWPLGQNISGGAEVGGMGRKG